MSRPTPRTDSAIMEIPSKFGSICVVRVELALDLEHELGDALRERDEAREKVEQQREEIVRLNGATNHAGGTPLKIALRERDEARETADHWKTEYEIVVARLCGKKHPRDNGIISEDEIIPKLERARDEAREEIKRLRYEAQIEAEHHDRMVKELEGLYDKLKS